MELIFDERRLVQPDSSSFIADPDLIRALAAQSTPVVCDSDKVLFHQDDAPIGVYILHQGAVSLTMCAHDGQTIFSISAQPGSLLGLPGVISDEPYSLTAVALSGANLGFVNRDAIFALMKSEPLLSLKMLQLLAAEVRTARQALSR